MSTIPRRIILGPGPSSAHPKVLNAMSNSVIGYLDPEFFKILEDVSKKLSKLFNSTGQSFAISGTGSAGMEAGFTNLISEGEKLLINGHFNDFGRLLNDAWTQKKALSNLITNSKINEIYDLAMKYGALGGKLLGAGGGGFLLMYMNKNKKKNFFKRNKKLVNIPFTFTNLGSEIIFDKLIKKI